MKSLNKYILEYLQNKVTSEEYFEEASNIFEGGASGHLKHIYDYLDLTLNDLKDIVKRLFKSEIEDITEKVDGVNIQVSMNNRDEVVFIRNKGDLNSDKGGMSLNDMYNKWASKQDIMKTFTEAGSILEGVLPKIGKKFFNPDPNKRLTLNCECIREGVTNIIPYQKSLVYIHDIWIYEKENDTWIHTDTTKNGLDDIQKHLNEHIKITPKVYININDNNSERIDFYNNTFNRLFKEYHLGNNDTIQDYYYQRFKEYFTKNYKDYFDGLNDMIISKFFNRIVLNDKSTNIRALKKDYGEIAGEIDKDKKLLKYLNKDFDRLFIKLGSDIIDLCSNLINNGFEDTSIESIKNELDNIQDRIEHSNDVKLKDKLLSELDRLGDNKINSTEGIVFNYNGKLMKLTSSFAPINQIIGLKYNL